MDLTGGYFIFWIHPRGIPLIFCYPLTLIGLRNGEMRFLACDSPIDHTIYDQYHPLGRAYKENSCHAWTNMDINISQNLWMIIIFQYDEK